MEEEKMNMIGINQPIIETQIRLSKDEKFVIHRTVIIDIKPVKYYEKVMEKKEE